MAEQPPNPKKDALVEDKETKPKKGRKVRRGGVRKRNMKAKPKRSRLQYLQVALPPLESDTPILQDLIEHAHSFNVSQHKRNIIVGYKPKKYKEAKKKLMETEYESQKLAFIEHSTTYDPLKKLMAMPRSFVDKEALRTHYDASEIVLIKRPYKYFKRSMYVLTFKTPQEAKLAMKRKFQYVEHFYRLQHLYKHVSEVLTKVKENRAKKVEKMKQKIKQRKEQSK